MASVVETGIAIAQAVGDTHSARPGPAAPARQDGELVPVGIPLSSTSSAQQMQVKGGNTTKTDRHPFLSGQGNVHDVPANMAPGSSVGVQGSRMTFFRVHDAHWAAIFAVSTICLFGFTVRGALRAFCDAGTANGNDDGDDALHVWGTIDGRLFGVVVILGISQSLLWLIVLYKFTHQFVSFTIRFAIVNMIVSLVISFLTWNIVGIVINGLLLVLKLVWFGWMQRRIAFASALVSASVASLATRKTIISVTIAWLLALAFQALACGCLYLAWGSTFDLTFPALITVFVLLTTMWCIEMARCVLYAVVARATTTWYYNSNGQTQASGGNVALFQHFGTLTLCAVVFAVLRIPKLMLATSRRSSNPFTKGCCMLCGCLACMSTILDRFEGYSIVYITKGTGMSLSNASMAMRRTIVNGGLGSVLFEGVVVDVIATGPTLAAFATAALAGGYCRLELHCDWWPDVAVAMVFGLVFGFSCLLLACAVIEAAYSAFFVCLAESPDTLRCDHPVVHGDLMRAWNAHGETLNSGSTELPLCMRAGAYQL